MTTATCRSCGAPIRWERTTTGKAIPLDLDPREDGNVVLIHIHGTPGDDIRAQVLPASQQALLLEPDATRYFTHFATCPQADTWRKPT